VLLLVVVLLVLVVVVVGHMRRHTFDRIATHQPTA
jgi:hypothetical protein